MIDHVQHGAGAALGGEGEDAQPDEAEVRDRGVGDEPLHVALADGEERGIQDADHRQDEDRRREIPRGLREQRQAVAQEPERARPCPARRPATPRRRPELRRRRPGSQVWNGTSGALIAKAMKKPRNSHFWVAPSGTLPMRSVIAKVRDPVVTYRPITDGEHQQAADERVQEELHRRVLPARAAEAADDEVHRHEHRFEEDVEQEDVGRGEDADHEELEEQQQAEVVLHVAVLPGRRRALLAAGPLSNEFHDGRMTAGTSMTDISTRTSAMPSTPKAMCTPKCLDPPPAALELEPVGVRRGVEVEGEDERVDDDDQRDRQADLLGELGLAAPAARTRRAIPPAGSAPAPPACSRGITGISPPAARPRRRSVPPSIDSA